jgi:hypothetical protein
MRNVPATVRTTGGGKWVAIRNVFFSVRVR